MEMKPFIKNMAGAAVLLFFLTVPAMAVEKEADWSKAGKEVREAGHAVGEAAENTWKKTKDKSVEVLEKTKDTSAEVWDKTKKTTAEVWDKTKETSAEVVEKTGELYKKVKAKVHSATAPAKE